MDATETLVTLTDMHLDHTGSVLVAVASVDRTLLGTKNKQTNKERMNRCTTVCYIVIVLTSTVFNRK